MAITHVSSSSAASAGTTSLVITAPASISDNDILILIVNANSSPTVTPPTGFNLIRSLTTPITAVVAVYYKRASSESGDYTVGLSSSQRITAAISVFRGCVTSGSPVDVENGAVTGGTGTPAAVDSPAVTTTVTNDMVLYLAADDNSTSSSWTPPSGMTESVDSASAAAVTIAYVIQASATSTGTLTGTCTDGAAANRYAGFTVALKEATATTSTSDFFQLFD